MTVDRYLVLGNPIRHSLSPRIHSLFALQTGETIEYESFLVETGHFGRTVKALQRSGIKGANVTVPFKEDAFNIADSLSEPARHAGAVNTLVFNLNGEIDGHNTDGLGLIRDITVNHDQSFTHKHVLILGAGGAVRGILKPLIEQEPASITIANRTLSKAEKLRELFEPYFTIGVREFNALADNRYDIVINGTSLGLNGEVAPIPDHILTDSAIAYDMMYGDGSLPFQKKLSEMGAGAVLDGLGMLVEQAAESFFIWRGIRPDTQPVIAALR